VLTGDTWGALRVGPRRLASGVGEGRLARTAFVVDDLVDVVGQATGTGVARWLTESAPAPRSAPIVDAAATRRNLCRQNECERIWPGHLGR
jgi:hypothetical protein